MVVGGVTFELLLPHPSEAHLPSSSLPASEKSGAGHMSWRRESARARSRRAPVTARQHSSAEPLHAFHLQPPPSCTSTTCSACRRPRSTHPPQHCTGNTDPTAQSAGPCSAIRPACSNGRHLREPPSHGRLHWFDGRTTQRHLTNTSLLCFLTCDCKPTPPRDTAVQNVSACLW